ncbi:MAG: class I SAM-dependent rRNA methyltransferase [Flavobacteriales bacterium]|nr:class I SAM-dependent rRNA methyltransferase [Flavobacteriales bacterium]
MSQARIFINDTHDRVFNGHPWIFATQVVKEEGTYLPGDVVQVFDAKHRPLGQGYINPKSMIRVRLLTTHVEERVNKALIEARIERAWRYRHRMGYRASCRVVFSEADQLPGLVVDKFNDILSIQFLTLGMERWKEVVIAALDALIKPAGMYLRNDVPIREKEGLLLEKGFIGKPFKTELVIEEEAPFDTLRPGTRLELANVPSGGVRVHMDVAVGQKTGHFLDQAFNHTAIQRMAKDARVLDCFTHTGGFALHAAKAGAKEVVGLDISEEAVALATRNAELNALSNCSFRTANVFDFLTEASRTGKQWDIIVLDPPAFAKSKGAMENAYRGYKEINLRALKCIPNGGYLVTCSCSQHLTPDLFRKMVAEAARDSGRSLREVYYGTQPPDHPILWGVPETHYLKCLILQVW